MAGSTRAKPGTPILLTCSVLALLCLAGCKEARDAAPGNADRQPIPVEVAVAERTELPVKIRRSAALRSRVDTRLVTESAGLVVSRPVPAGARVSEGAVIARLSDATEVATLKAARARLTGLLAEGVSLAARQQAEAAVEQAEEALRMRTVVAPADGIMDRYDMEIGDYAIPGAPVGRLVDPSKLWMIATVLEEEILGVEPGTTVALSVPAWPDQSFAGKVVRRGAAALAGSGQFEIEIDVDADDRLFPGFVATVEIPVKGTQPRLLVPRDALFQRHGTWQLFAVVDSEGAPRARERSVKIRSVPWRPDLADVTSGLEPGTRVVTRGRLGLTDGDPLRIVEP